MADAIFTVRMGAVSLLELAQHILRLTEVSVAVGTWRNGRIVSGVKFYM